MHHYPTNSLGNISISKSCRGLIKWYCSTGGGDCKKKKKKTGARRRSKKHEFDEREDPATASVDQKMFFLEISPDCAFGPGAIELICLEEKVDYSTQNNKINSNVELIFLRQNYCRWTSCVG